MSGEPEILLTARKAGRHHDRLALLVVAGLLFSLLVSTPFAGMSLHGTEPLLPAYAAAVLIFDLIAATLLLSQFAVHGLVALLVLATGYLVTGLTVVPWVMTFPGVFSETGLLGSGLQTTALIAAVRRIAFPLSLLVYAILQCRSHPAVVDASMTKMMVFAAVAGSLLVSVMTTWAAVAGEELLPRFMIDPRVSTSIWTLVLYMALLLTFATMALLLVRRQRSILDLWVLVTLAALLNEIMLLGFLGAGLRFSVGWWMGRVFGLVSASVVMLALLAETTTLHARLLKSLVAESRAKDARATMLEALSAALAHELNQPLASIVTSANAATRWLDRPRPELEEVRLRLRRIATDGHAAGTIIDSVRRAFGKRPPRRDTVDLAALIRDAVEATDVEARHAEIRFALDIPADLPPILGDPMALRQAVLNLLANAVDAVTDVDQARRTIRVTCSCHQSHVSIAVLDNGIGLGSEVDPFQPFHSSKPHGMGLGLMISRTIIEAHGGRLEAGPNSPHGAMFEIILPAAQISTGNSTHG